MHSLGWAVASCAADGWEGKQSIQAPEVTFGGVSWQLLTLSVPCATCPFLAGPVPRWEEGMCVCVGRAVWYGKLRQAPAWPESATRGDFAFLFLHKAGGSQRTQTPAGKVWKVGKKPPPVPFWSRGKPQRFFFFKVSAGGGGCCCTPGHLQISCLEPPPPAVVVFWSKESGKVHKFSIGVWGRQVFFFFLLVGQEVCVCVCVGWT